MTSYQRVYGKGRYDGFILGVVLTLITVFVYYVSKGSQAQPEHI